MGESRNRLTGFDLGTVRQKLDDIQMEDDRPRMDRFRKMSVRRSWKKRACSWKNWVEHKKLKKAGAGADSLE